MPRLAATSHTHSRGTRLSACKIRARVGSASSANTAVARSISATPASRPRTAVTSAGWTDRTAHESVTIERLRIHNSLAQERSPPPAPPAVQGWPEPPATGRMPGGLADDTPGETGNTQTVTGVPAPTLYHRWLGWHALAMRRALTVLIAGLIVAVVLLPFVTWGLALAGGWDAAALTF